MSQPSVVQYFNTRKRAAAGDPLASKARKVLVLDTKNKVFCNADKTAILLEPKIKDSPRDLKRKENLSELKKNLFQETNTKSSKKKVIRGLFEDICARKEAVSENKEETVSANKEEAFAKKEEPFAKKEEAFENKEEATTNKEEASANKESLAEASAPAAAVCESLAINNAPVKVTSALSKITTQSSVVSVQATAVNTEPMVVNTSDVNHEPSLASNKLAASKDLSKPSLKKKVETKIPERAKVPELDLGKIKDKLTRSEKLAELKASLIRFKQAEAKLKQVEKKKEDLAEKVEPKNVKTLQNFKSFEVEVQLSPQKVHTPEKIYLSPKKNVGARKNLFSPAKNLASSPSKNLLESTLKPSLSLPYKYRYLAEIFRSIDTVCQILHNRKETITFRKLKHAVEEMLKRNLYEKHLAQIKDLYPEAFDFKVEKLRVFGMGKHKEQWELVINPKVDSDLMTPEILLQRRRNLYNTLIEKLKLYHHEFLITLNPSLNIPVAKITRWHPEFDIENVPDIPSAVLPQPPTDDKILTGQEVLEKAKLMLGTNRRLEAALEKLKQDDNPIKPDIPLSEGNPVLKGIPKALLEKVRQRQAAKALESMTRSTGQEKEAQMYARLPEIVRKVRNLFVSEKKSVLQLDAVVEKLNNSFRISMTKIEIEEHLTLISKEVPNWLVLHKVRNVMYLKISKNDDLNCILKLLEVKIREKCA